ncbi:heterokaryon incompatibility protein (HET) domain-containing protein [Apiospora saccharicola]|uniref:Heterokaryon incompatibility protein (HET) domain-containing protein n=1 Tax=Apiospora saccharicola TaxID=335842 RepID=A0ABR1WG05_9PEZI
MKGWYKMRNSCEQALGNGLDYLLADALCIDKSSKSELSESINSMSICCRASAIRHRDSVGTS